MELPDIARVMREKSLTLVTAESCTAGLIASRLADLPGAGKLLECAFVTYSSQSKQRCLDVSPVTIAQHNLTSEAVAIEMALGALNRSSANLAVANTGVVDDTDPRIPAGTQCFAWAVRQGDGGADVQVYSETCRFRGDRHEIRAAAAEQALQRIPAVIGCAPLPENLHGPMECLE